MDSTSSILLRIQNMMSKIKNPDNEIEKLYRDLILQNENDNKQAMKSISMSLSGILEDAIRENLMNPQEIDDTLVQLNEELFLLIE